MGPLDSTEILTACSVFEPLTRIHESSSIIALIPSMVRILDDSLSRILDIFSISLSCKKDGKEILVLICEYLT